MEHPIFEKIERAAKPDFGEVLSKSFDLGKLVWKEALVHALIVAAFMLPFLILIYVPILPIYIEILQGNAHYVDRMIMDYSPMWWLGYSIAILVLSFLMQVVSISVTAHFYKVCKNVDLGTNEEVGGYFDLVKTNFSKLLLLSVATFFISIAAVLLCYLPLFYVMVPLQLIIPILAYNNKLGVSDLLKAAFKLGNKYWIIAFGLIWLSSLIAQIGLIFCGIGILVTAYYVHLTMYYFYKDSVGFDEPAAQLNE